MKTIVKFHNQPLEFWRKPAGTRVCSTVGEDKKATRFLTEQDARLAVVACRLDPEHITYHNVN